LTHEALVRKLIAIRDAVPLTQFQPTTKITPLRVKLKDSPIQQRQARGDDLLPFLEPSVMEDCKDEA